MPDLSAFTDAHITDDFLLILDGDESPEAIKTKLATFSANNVIAYGHGQSPYWVGNNLWTKSIAAGGYHYITESGWGYPTNILFDRDGMIRKFGIGSIHNNPTLWEDAAKELMGIN